MKTLRKPWMVIVAVMLICAIAFGCYYFKAKTAAELKESPVVTEEYYKGIYIGPNARGKVTEEDVEKFIAENSDKDVSEIAIMDVEKAD